MKVVKFGGSSLATGNQIKKVFNIVVSDPNRKIVVVSAPGKRNFNDIKVTDLLIKCASSILNYRKLTDEIDIIINRYKSIADELDLPQNIINEIKLDLKNLLNSDKSNPERFMDAVKASGEDHNAKLIAAYFQKQGYEAYYVNPKDAGLIVTDEPGNAQVLLESYQRLYLLRYRSGILVVPGFFGYNKKGEVITFSRGGSDITGAIIANSIKADIYENFTDVDCVFTVNPDIKENPQKIKELTYREMRELSYAGFTVFHEEALIPAFRANIPVNIKNTNNPKEFGTMVVENRYNENQPVVGIASDRGFCSIYIRKILMNREIGFGRRILQILEDFKLAYEHVPSGIDDMNVILRQEKITQDIKKEIVYRLESELNVDEIKFEHDLALLMVVGEGMRHNVGTTAKATKALSLAGVNIEMINQGSSEVSMMFGIKAIDEKTAVKALYNEFFAGVLV